MRSHTPAVLLALPLLALAACAATPAEDPDDGGAAAEDGPAELTAITVGAMPIVDTAALHLGIAEGVFAEHGLEVDVVQAQGGAAIVPAVASGQHEFGFSNVISLLQARERGIDLQIVSPASASSGDTSADLSAILTMPGSGISEPADLAGRSVAVNTSANIGEVMVRTLVAEDADPEDVDFIELPFPDMPAQLVAGRVDAVWITEPFLTLARDRGAEVVVFDYATIDPEMMIDAYITTDAYAAEHPEVVAAFSAAMADSLELATAQPEAARAAVAGYTEIDPEVLERLSMPRFPPELNVASLELMAELAHAAGVLDDPGVAAELVP
ncbi:ABC transporter substrate-binding protein [Bogoriella caseilytica]|uniref:NitT/TauT family transport system substrate-binding protein n=1 Tax=Bogoriella caseilytica TaxID=56055 RepID=A0A3N2BGL2_9MICO|nr:ABC transporter substrate-binding protein [Bogoriella caseilytica]ROR74393.1 NitT/TauT family transport system substrate-binding protein [Bogoriella caseilytica]